MGRTRRQGQCRARKRLRQVLFTGKSPVSCLDGRADTGPVPVPSDRSSLAPASGALPGQRRWTVRYASMPVAKSRNLRPSERSPDRGWVLSSRHGGRQRAAWRTRQHASRFRRLVFRHCGDVSPLPFKVPGDQKNSRGGLNQSILSFRARRGILRINSMGLTRSVV